VPLPFYGGPRQCCRSGTGVALQARDIACARTIAFEVERLYHPGVIWAHRHRHLVFICSVVLSRCGGEAVVDMSDQDSGAGGASQSGNTQCDRLLDDLHQAISDATSCMCGQFDGCFLGPLISDECGCLIGASKYGSVAAAAENAYSAWASAGCGPKACTQACYVGSSWGCGSPAGTCAYGQPGRCTHGDY